MPTTMSDIARLAGVSAATVSVALRDKPGVSPSMRAHIRDIAEQLGYRPNRVGRALRQSRTGSIGLYLPSSATDFSYYTEVSRGIAETLAQHELSLMILPNLNDSDDISLLPPVDGYILVEPHARDRGVRALLHQDRPVVCGDEPPPRSGTPWGIVESPNDQTTREVFNRFLTYGARRPGLVLIERVSSWTRQLETTYLDWCQEHAVEPRVVLTGHSRSNDRILHDLQPWFDPGNGCDAVLVAGDGVAVRIAGILRSLGHQVGQSVRLVSGVDSVMMEYHTPRITAVDLRPRLFGQECAAMLVDLIGQDKPAQPVRKTVDAFLVERESG